MTGCRISTKVIVANFNQHVRCSSKSRSITIYFGFRRQFGVPSWSGVTFFHLALIWGAGGLVKSLRATEWSHGPLPSLYQGE